MLTDQSPSAGDVNYSQEGEFAARCRQGGRTSPTRVAPSPCCVCQPPLPRPFPEQVFSVLNTIAESRGEELASWSDALKEKLRSHAMSAVWEHLRSVFPSKSKAPLHQCPVPAPASSHQSLFLEPRSFLLLIPPVESNTPHCTRTLWLG